MNEIDWSKAPEGATHYNHIYVDWYKVGSHEPSFWNGRAWAPARFWDDRKHDCIQRPTTPSWSGEGLPPVGIDIEVLHELYGWIGARVVGQDGEAAIVRTNDGYAGVFQHQIRPLRTPEQIEADEREAAIDEMLAATPAPGSDISLRVCEKLYDAGYRKP